MARVKINRELALKSFCESLIATFGTRSYTRSEVEQIGKTNGVGQTMFASKTIGYGESTRTGQGSYIIPEAWNSGSAPWEGIVVEVPVPKAAKPTKAPKEVKEKKVKAKQVEVADAPPAVQKVKVAMSKKDLLAKAKEVVAANKKKAASAASA